jgi:lipid II:glycine glycyltransferase (peptidoglycan interpeptide bridge formation enzyme)
MRAIGIRLEPNVRIENREGRIRNLKPGRPLFKKKTIFLDLTKSEEELLKNMHPKGRYNIKVAQKHGVVIREDNSSEAFNKYLELIFSGTTKRQKIYSHGKDYHRLMWNSLKENLAHLFVAEYEKDIIAASIILKFKEGIYYAYGASALEHKEVMAPTVLLWEVARWGKNQGCKFFDLWGAEEGKGFSRFKEQFGGETVELAGSYDLPVNKWLYSLFRAAEEIRWKILRKLK